MKNVYKNYIAFSSALLLMVAGFQHVGNYNLPYGFFQILRIVVFIGSIYISIAAHEANSIKWIWVMVVIAILFNPIFPIYLTKEIWLFIDIVVSLIFIVCIFKIKFIDRD